MTTLFGVIKIATSCVCTGGNVRWPRKIGQLFKVYSTD